MSLFMGLYIFALAVSLWLLFGAYLVFKDEDEDTGVLDFFAVVGYSSLATF